MKSLIIATIIFLTLGRSKQPDYISFEYSGDTNKNVDMIFISKSPLAESDMVTTLPWTAGGYNYIVTDKEFKIIEKSIAATEMEKKPEYKGFKIVERKNGLLTRYFVSAEKSGFLWRKVLEGLQANPKDKDLVKDFEYLGSPHG